MPVLKRSKKKEAPGEKPEEPKKVAELPSPEPSPEVRVDKALKVKVDQLEASVTGLMALREPTEARISMLNEKIGELRTMILSQAKDSADARAKAERALGALEGIKPEEFRSMIMRRDKDIEGLKTKFSLLEDEIRELRKEIAGYREIMAKFKGFETVVGMADDARKNIMRIQQLRDQVELMSDKVMSAFMEFQRRLKEVADMSVKFGVLEENVKTMSKTLGQIDAAVRQALPKAEFEKFISTQLTAKLKSEVDPVEFSKIKDLVETLKDVSEKSEKRFSRIEREIKVVETGISKLLDALI